MSYREQLRRGGLYFVEMEKRYYWQDSYVDIMGPRFGGRRDCRYRNKLYFLGRRSIEPDAPIHICDEEISFEGSEYNKDEYYKDDDDNDDDDDGKDDGKGDGGDGGAAKALSFQEQVAAAEAATKRRMGLWLRKHCHGDVHELMAIPGFESMTKEARLEYADLAGVPKAELLKPRALDDAVVRLLGDGLNKSAICEFVEKNGGNCVTERYGQFGDATHVVVGSVNMTGFYASIQHMKGGTGVEVTFDDLKNLVSAWKESGSKWQDDHASRKAAEAEAAAKPHALDGMEALLVGQCGNHAVLQYYVESRGGKCHLYTGHATSPITHVVAGATGTYRYKELTAALEKGEGGAVVVSADDIKGLVAAWEADGTTWHADHAARKEKQDIEDAKPKPLVDMYTVLVGRFPNKHAMQYYIESRGGYCDLDVSKSMQYTHVVLGQSGSTMYGQATGEGSKKFTQAKKQAYGVVVSKEDVEALVAAFEADGSTWQDDHARRREVVEAEKAKAKKEKAKKAAERKKLAAAKKKAMAERAAERAKNQGPVRRSKRQRTKK